MNRNKITVLCLFLIALVANVRSQTPASTPISQGKLLQHDPELQRFLQRFEFFQDRVSSEMWTLIHAYDSKDEVDQVLNYYLEFFKTVGSDDVTKYDKMGGIQGFKEKFSGFLDSKDPAVKSFALFNIGVMGDKSFASRIAKIVDARDPSFFDRFTGEHVFYRGRAAIALGMLGATEFKPNISNLLKSKNESDRSGAIFALADLHGTEYTSQIVGILTDKEFKFEDDDSPIYFLVQTGQEQNYKKEIASTLSNEFKSKTSETAAYALAAMDAKEFAPTIASSLSNRFRRSWAVKALALMNAMEYSDQIALLLKDESILVRSAAATSLGILHSTKHIPLIARLLTDEDGSVRHDAAGALIRLEASKYYAAALQVYGSGQVGKDWSVTNYHEFVRNKVEQLNAELEKKLAVARASTKIKP